MGVATSPPIDDPALAATAEVAELARALADEPIDRDRLPDEVVRAARRAGLYRLCLPSELGGSGTPMPLIVAIVERLAFADGSTGWCAAVANAGASLLSGVAEREARIIAADPETLVIAGGFPPLGQARQHGDDFEVSGRWPFASGCTAATWFLGGIQVVSADGGAPGARVAFFPADQARIIRNWDVLGLRATGSHDVAAERLTVPVHRSTTLFGAPRWSADPLAAIPFFALGSLLAAVPLGVAARALDELRLLSSTRVPSGQRHSLAEDPVFHDHLGTMLTRLGAARAYLFERTEFLWQSAVAGAVPPAVQAEVSMAVGAAVDAALEVVQFAHRSAGVAALRNPHILTRCHNDVVAASRHAAFRPTSRQAGARSFLGLPPE
ncbi:acyl-CoA dehydrogenase family protein [Nocardia brasiliensis]|uniref:acyl-CoA dehydrogenase family protein n=1 Tax=Nocardia brasiliensis TaxID=37326 RepID=UPI0018947CD8|nr:acyl-CoA dehydrogenase family protein [Nocardia brasiliensis]MBF6545675.1 acyl-CoA dehydrogenase family protein [Nocardia brasiliensis]